MLEVGFEMEQTGKPFLVMKKKSKRMVGSEAQRFNILTACVIAELIRTTLGPLGFDKLIIDPVNEIIITNDGSTIMKNFEVRHPMARIMDKLVRSMDDSVGDGSKTAIILVGELLKKAQIKLMDEGVHPSSIIDGYEKALDQALIEAEKLGYEINPNDDSVLEQVALTAIGGRFGEEVERKFARIAVKAIRYIAEEKDGQLHIDVKNNISVISKRGESLLESELLDGVAIDKEIASPTMPKRIEGARIAVIEPSIELKILKIVDTKNTRVEVSSLTQQRAFRNEDYRRLKAKVTKIIQSGANVVFARRDLHDKICPYLEKAGILAAKWVRGWDMEKIARATGAKIIKNLDYLTPEALGHAELVEERQLARSQVIFITGCKNPKAITILNRAGIEHLLYEGERRLMDAMYSVRDVLIKGKIVGGGGAFEMALSRRLKEYSRRLKGRERLAFETYANCLEVIPFTLAQSAGLSPLDVITRLRQVHSADTEEARWFGVNIEDIKPKNMLNARILDPLAVKIQAIGAASEVALIILGIDDVLHAQPGEYEKTIEEEEYEEEMKEKMEEVKRRARESRTPR